jgi:hypothetical protein
LTDQEQGLLSFLSRDNWKEIQEIILRTWGDIQDIIQLLTMLEIKWLVSHDTPGKYILL